MWKSNICLNVYSSYFTVTINTRSSGRKEDVEEKNKNVP